MLKIENQNREELSRAKRVRKEGKKKKKNETLWKIARSKTNDVIKKKQKEKKNENAFHSQYFFFFFSYLEQSSLLMPPTSNFLSKTPLKRHSYYVASSDTIFIYHAATKLQSLKSSPKPTRVVITMGKKSVGFISSLDLEGKKVLPKT